jgi:hypothetical protein
MLPVYVDAHGDGHAHRGCICVTSEKRGMSRRFALDAIELLAGDGLPDLFGVAAQIEQAASDLVVGTRDIDQ